MNLDYDRLLHLKRLIDNNQATISDKNEYMKILLQNGSITQNQYNSYMKNQNSEEIVRAALTIGGVILAAWLISKLVED